MRINFQISINCTDVTASIPVVDSLPFVSELSSNLSSDKQDHPSSDNGSDLLHGSSLFTSSCEIAFSLNILQLVSKTDVKILFTRDESTESSLDLPLASLFSHYHCNFTSSLLLGYEFHSAEVELSLSDISDDLYSTPF
ncbi:hypothetical protein GEMRC1_004836 [Eukaryota sp. GEM-RC1]